MGVRERTLVSDYQLPLSETVVEFVKSSTTGIGVSGASPNMDTDVANGKLRLSLIYLHDLSGASLGQLSKNNWLLVPSVPLESS